VQKKFKDISVSLCIVCTTNVEIMTYSLKLVQIVHV